MNKNITFTEEELAEIEIEAQQIIADEQQREEATVVLTPEEAEEIAEIEHKMAKRRAVKKRVKEIKTAK